MCKVGRRKCCISHGSLYSRNQQPQDTLVPASVRHLWSRELERASMNTTSLIQSITAAADGSLDGIENEDRIQLMTACDQLRRSLETPLEASERFLFGVRILPPDFYFIG